TNYSWYLNLTQNLLNILRTKTQTDKLLSEALDIPSTENLEKLITDKARWAGLKEEQQGLVQLLLGQNAATEGQDLQLQQLNHIIDKLAFDLDLKTPDVIEAQTQTAKLKSSLWLTYAHRQAQLIGRENDLQQLDSFFDQDESFSWWVITGAGGIGKSRLVLEALISHQNTWEVGFLPTEKLKKADALSQWQPKAPTIIVIDYAAEYAKPIEAWLDHFIQQEQSYPFPIRLLILEREIRQQTWWDELTQSGSGALVRNEYLYTQAPHELTLLTKQQQQTALQSFLDNLESKITLPESDNDFWESLHTLSNEGRPLFIGMVAVAIADNGINHIRKWDRQALLEGVLKHEEKMWDRQLASYNDQQKTDTLQLLAFNTVTGGLLNTEDETLLDNALEALMKSGIASNDKELADYWESVTKLVGHQGGYLQPDIFAEFFVIRRWQESTALANRTLKKYLTIAYQLAPESTLAFITRCATDYPENKNAWTWWSWLQSALKQDEQDKNETILNELAFSIIGQLSLQGSYQYALAYWLPPLCEVEDPKSKARALNLKAKQYHHIGKYDEALPLYEQSLTIQQEVGDKSGEGTTLNNISQIYDARGDYETALDYLKQSLTIRQEIGDKSGEGTTLNNISQIFKARGDYETALDYLKQSLTIQQEIGDKSGEGTTLNNISQIFKARGDYETALDYLKQSLTIRQEIGDIAGSCFTLFNMGHIYWQAEEHKKAKRTWATVYVMAKPMKLAQALDALEGLAEYLGLPDGLESWEKFEVDRSLLPPPL
ncbi:MAG: tetratricopeptide repeat protein, partial [Thiotrichaceae bacterium]